MDAGHDSSLVTEGEAATVSFASLEQALISARRATAAAGAAFGAQVVNAAFEQGLRSNAASAPIRWPDDLPADDDSDEQRRRAALIAGHLVRDRLVGGTALSQADFLATIAYASALATPQAQRILADLGGGELLKAHTYACVLSERHRHEVGESEETRLFSWLLAQADLALTPTLERQMLSRRARRRERTRNQIPDA
jgi:hypothetical protein